jgi:peptide/nickel transport system substrate-binding protein
MEVRRVGRALRWALVACLTALAACTSAEQQVGEPSPDTRSATDGEARVGGSVTVGLEAESLGYSPWQDALAASGLTVARAFYDTLLERDADGVPRPNLAARFEANGDFTEYVLTLREGIDFHDGEPLDAEAVVANLDHFLRPGAGGEGPLEELVAEDELTVRIGLSRPHVALGDVLAGQAGMMVSPAAFETTRDRPVGTGPFVFDSWRRDQELVVTRNDDYWREGLPYLEQITFRPIPDEESRWQSLLSGDVDAVQSLRQSVVAQARDQGDALNVFEHLGNESGATIHNTEAPPLDDVRVRRAAAHALDQEALIAVLGGTGISPPARGLFHPTSPWYDPVTEDVWPTHDLETAQRLVDDYVADPDRSDGEPTGAPVSFTLDTPPDPSLIEAAGVYQDQLGRAGIAVALRTVEQAVHIQEAIGSPPDFVGDFQAKFWRLGSDDDPDWMSTWFAPGSPINFTNFSTPELMDLLVEAQRSPEHDRRRELYAEVMAIFAEQAPFTLSGHTASVIAASPELHGFDDWRLPDGQPGIGHPGAQARWHEVRLDQP